MLLFARACENDVFYDLGCGAGQLCIIAVKEFNVRRAVGIDCHKGRVKKARARVKELGLEGRMRIQKAYFQDVNLKPATIAYCGVEELPDSLEILQKRLRRGCKLVTPNLPLVSVIPDKIDYPFYMMISPFKRAKSIDEWASHILMREGGFEELVDELRKDPDWQTDIKALRRLVRIRFQA
jgi:trans-aconitate methyltransferase